MKSGRTASALVVGASLFLVLVFALGCAKKPAAVVNGEPITEKMIERALAGRLAQHGAQGVSVDKDALRKVVIEQLISEKLLLQGAREHKLTATEEEADVEIGALRKNMGEDAFRKSLKEEGLTVAGFRQSLKDKMAITKFIDSLVPAAAVGEDEIRSFYSTSNIPFLKPESVEVRFIQTAAKEDAEIVMRELRSGKNFDSLAVSLEKEKRAIISDYGWTHAGFYGPEIAAALKGIKKGAYGGPYKGKDAYFILRVRDRQPQRPETLDEARDKIKNMLLEHKRQSAVAHWVAEKRAKGKVVIN